MGFYRPRLPLPADTRHGWRVRLRFLSVSDWLTDDPVQLLGSGLGLHLPCSSDDKYVAGTKLTISREDTNKWASRRIYPESPQNWGSDSYQSLDAEGSELIARARPLPMNTRVHVHSHTA